MGRDKETSPCRGCDRARACINGLYCIKLLRYVEHVRKKPCDNYYE